MEKIDELEKRIIGETWTGPEIYANVEQLCDFGSRFSWTESERQARDFIQVIIWGGPEVRRVFA